MADRRQNLHFESVFRVCEKLGLRQKFEFLGFGTVNGKDGKPFKTRSGHTPKLDDLFKETKEIFTTSSEKNQNMSEEDLDILVNAIIKFADLQNNREKDYIFDIDRLLLLKEIQVHTSCIRSSVSNRSKQISRSWKR